MKKDELKMKTIEERFKKMTEYYFDELYYKTIYKDGETILDKIEQIFYGWNFSEETEIMAKTASMFIKNEMEKL